MSISKEKLSNPYAKAQFAILFTFFPNFREVTLVLPKILPPIVVIDSGKVIVVAFVAQEKQLVPNIYTLSSISI